VLLYAIGLIGAVSHSSALLLKHLEHCIGQLAVTSSEMDADPNAWALATNPAPKRSNYD